MDRNDHQISATSTLDNDKTGFRIKGAASRGKHKQKDESEPCTICLQPITERAIAVPCNHLMFDFLCLLSWLEQQPTCPLCKADVKEVQYDWRGPEDWKTYRVLESTLESRRRRGTRPPPVPAPVVHDPRLERRRQVYRERLFSRHVGANDFSGYRDFTPADFATSAELQSRARSFLRRELQVFPFLDPVPTARRGGRTREYLREYIVAVLKQHELKGASGQAEDLMAEYLGRENAQLLAHELEAFLRSPCGRLEEWDRVVQYPGAQVQRDGKGVGAG